MASKAFKHRTLIVTYVECLTFVKVFFWILLSVCSNGEEQTATGGACTNSLCEQKCHVTLGAELPYSCGCYLGFVIDDDGFGCIDIDECQGSSVCPVALVAGLCINTIGSYYCTCPVGFLFDVNTWQCLDVDECDTTLEYCDHICINTLGSYRCDCLDGYSMNAVTSICDDVDECDLDRNCDYQCRNTDGGFYCICPSGYTLLPSGRNCTEFVEASFGLSPSVDNGFIWVQVSGDTLYPQYVCETRDNSIRFTELRVICRSVGLFPVRVLSNQTDREHLPLADLDSVRFIGKNLVCDGDEENILQCFRDKVTGLECTSAQMVAIQCISDAETMLRVKSLRVPRSFALVRPFAYFALDIGWVEQFHLANNFTMNGMVFVVGRLDRKMQVVGQEVTAHVISNYFLVACSQIGLEPLYLSGWFSSSPKPNIECQSPDISSLDQCKFFVMKSHDFQVLCLQTGLVQSQVFHPKVGFTEMTSLDRESQAVVTFHVWTCAGAKVRLLSREGVENKFLELQFNAFNFQNHSENVYISIWECIRNESCSPNAQWNVGKIFSCRAPYMLQTSFWTTINFTFLSSNVLTIESSLKGHWENDALPELRTSVNLTLPISHHMLPLIGFGNSNHEMMLKIHRKPGVNQCLMNPKTDNYSQCGDDFVNRNQCLRCGCCWIQDKCYFPRYSTYLGCYQGPDVLNWQTSFALAAGISTESDCNDRCRMEQFLYAAMQTNYCFCGNKSYKTQILCSNPSSGYALFDTLLLLMQACYRDISVITGKVLLTADPPRFVGEDVNLMVMIENYIKKKMIMEMDWGDGSQNIPFSATEVKPALSRNLPKFCLNPNSLCGHLRPYRYSKGGSYDLMFKLQGKSAVNAVRRNITLVALSSILLETYLQHYGVVNNGPGLVFHPVTFVVYVKNPSPDMKVVFDPMDGTKKKEMKVKNVESVPIWVYRKTGFPDHMLMQFCWLMIRHVFAESGHVRVVVTISDSARDRYRESVLVHSEVDVGLFDKYIGMAYLFNNGPVLKHNTVSLFFVIENITPKLYVDISTSSVQLKQRLNLTKECDIPEFVQLQTAKRISVVELRAFYCSTSNISFNEPGLHEVEAYVGDPDLEKYSRENSTGFLRIKTVAKVLSLESFLGQLFFFNDGPVLQNLFINFVFCIEKYIQNLELQVDFGDGNQSVANYIPSRINTYPDWAVALLLKTSRSQVDNINKLHCMTMKHSYSGGNSSEYFSSVSIYDKSSNFEADVVSANTSVHVLSFEDAMGKTFLVPDELSMSQQMSGIWFFSEKIFNGCVLRISPGDGTDSKQVSVERDRNLPEWLQKQLKPDLLNLVKTRNFFVGILDHWYELAGLYVVRAEILCDESLVWEETAITNVSCYSQIDLSTGAQDKEKALNHVRKDGFRMAVNVIQYCSSEPIKYSWSVFAVSTNDDAANSSSQEYTTSLPSSVSLISQELVLPPHSLEAALYLFHVKVIFELHNSSLSLAANSWVQFVDTPIVANIMGEYRRIAEMNEVVIFDASNSADVTVPPEEQHFNLNYNWFCLRAGETLPSGIMTDGVSLPTVGGCFGTGIKLKGVLPILEIHTKSLIYESLPEDYTVHMFVKKVGLPMANVSVILSVRGSGGLPQIIITCISNCARQFNSTQTLELAGHCTNCNRNEKLDLSWDVTPVTDTCVIKQFEWAKYVIPQISLDRLAIRPNTFTTTEDNDVYKVTLTATKKQNTQVATGTRYISPKPIRINEEMEISHSD